MTLHRPLLAALEPALLRASEPEVRPLEIDLAEPHPARLRIYAYSLLDGTGTVRGNEGKINVRLPGVGVGEYGSFDWSGDRVPVVLGYSRVLDVVVLWDATMRDRIKHAGNLQVQMETVHAASTEGWSIQARRPKEGRCEVIVACRTGRLLDALDERIRLSGGLPEDQCQD